MDDQDKKILTRIVNYLMGYEFRQLILMLVFTILIFQLGAMNTLMFEDHIDRECGNSVLRSVDMFGRGFIVMKPNPNITIDEYYAAGFHYGKGYNITKGNKTIIPGVVYIGGE